MAGVEPASVVSETIIFPLDDTPGLTVAAVENTAVLLIMESRYGDVAILVATIFGTACSAVSAVFCAVWRYCR